MGFLEMLEFLSSDFFVTLDNIFDALLLEDLSDLIDFVSVLLLPVVVLPLCKCTYFSFIFLVRMLFIQVHCQSQIYPHLFFRSTN